MSEQIKDAILALQGGNSTAFKDAVNNELMNRAMDSINLQKINAGQSFFNDEEEVEDEDEVEVDVEDEIEEEEPEENDEDQEEPADEEV